MKQIFLLCALLPCFLFADTDLFFSDEEDPAMFEHVNVITGHMHLSFQDVDIPGALPIAIHRSYSTTGALEPVNGEIDLVLNERAHKFLIQGGWSFLPHVHLFMEFSRLEDEKHAFFIEEKSGSLIRYAFEKKQGKTLTFKPDDSKFNNLSNLNARMNPANNRLQYRCRSEDLILQLADGGKRIYRFSKGQSHKKGTLYHFHLVKEISCDLFETHYEYDKEERLRKIRYTAPCKRKTFAVIDVEVLQKAGDRSPYHFTLRTSCGHVLDYKAMMHEDRHYLQRVQSNCRPFEEIGYLPGRKGIGARLHTLTLAGHPQLAVHYYEPSCKKDERKWDKHPDKKAFSIDKVKKVDAMLASDGSWATLAEFFYAPSRTDVRDAMGQLSRYHHDGKRLNSIEYFDEQEHLAYSLRFFWEGARLKAKVFLDNTGTPLFSKVFTYNAAHDVIQETFFGNLTGQATDPFILRGDGSLEHAESYCRFYTYDPVTHLHLQEREEQGLTYLYTYKPATTLITSKLTTDGSSILLREFFFYDPDTHLLMKETSDDGTTPHYDDLTGVTQRHIKEYERESSNGVVTQLKESYLENGSFKQLKRTQYLYSSQNRIVAEKVYNAEDDYCYTIDTDYDSSGHIVSKTTPSGYKNSYGYGSQGELLSSKEEGTLAKVITYNKARLPTSTTEVDHSGHPRTTHLTYDAKGRLVMQSDPDGHETVQVYDAFGRCVQSSFAQIKDPDGNPYKPTVSFSYDAAGNLVSTTSPKGDTSYTAYNTFRKPIIVTQADGSVTYHRYNLCNLLVKTLYPDGTYVNYTYDAQHRKVAEEVYSSRQELLSTQTWEYNALHLLSHTNPQGLTTYYTYDGAGRLIEEKAEGRSVHYAYDALGYLTKKTYGDTTSVTMHDTAGRVVREYTEDSTGKKENETTFSYDEEGRKVKASRLTSQGEAVDLFQYDPRNRLAVHVDPLGASTQFLYLEVTNDLGQQVLQKTTIDPTGLSTIFTYDALDHLVCEEKRDVAQQTVGLVRYLYDLSGNCAKRLTTLYHNTIPMQVQTTTWQYDAEGRVIVEQEHPDKITLFSYTLAGLLATKTLPGGTTLYYTYDGLGRLTEQRSTDHTIHYRYLYDQSTHPIQIDDLIHQTTLYHTYNLFDELIHEVNPYGLTTHWTYDDQGRLRTLTLPDRSFIHYHYTGSHLSAVERPEYTHLYLSYDPNGNPSLESLIHHLGTRTTQRDRLERPIAQNSPHLYQTSSYSPSGLLLSQTNSLLGPKHFSYDSLNQLTQENDNRYAFDSLGNPVQATINSYNQILSTATTTLTYDPQGNPTYRSNSDTTYTYDALSRLTTITTPSATITYTYDALDRLIRKQTEETLSSLPALQQCTTTLYLYDQDYEIGSCTQDANILELKVLGLGIKGDVGAAVAMELNGISYAPYHDFCGHVIALIAPDGSIYETYPTDAFGASTLTDPSCNPWRFFSKRLDQDLILFGKRFYDPSLSRFLTPDPAGFLDSPNLYLFVLNNPVNRLDLFGLSSELNYAQYTPPSFDFGFGNGIYIPIGSIQNLSLSSQRQTLAAKGAANRIYDSYVVVSSQFHKIQYTPEELQSGLVNIIDHFADLVPKEGSFIGLVSYQNGVANTDKDFRASCATIFNSIPESTLFIGKYNPATGIAHAGRLGKEFLGMDTTVVRDTRQFLVTLADRLQAINPKLIWMHLAHSEGGMILHRAIKGMIPDEQAKLKCLYAATFGAAHPVSEKHLGRCINYYSEKDWVTKPFGKKCQSREYYDIKFVKCVTPLKHRLLGVADHTFIRKTYQKSKDDFIELVTEKFPFYDAKAY